jgi:hypothetical protein
MAKKKVVPFEEFYYQLKLMYLFQKHPVCITEIDNNICIVIRVAQDSLNEHVRHVL